MHIQATAYCNLQFARNSESMLFIRCSAGATNEQHAPAVILNPERLLLTCPMSNTAIGVLLGFSLVLTRVQLCRLVCYIDPAPSQFVTTPYTASVHVLSEAMCFFSQGVVYS